MASDNNIQPVADQQLFGNSEQLEKKAITISKL